MNFLPEGVKAHAACIDCANQTRHCILLEDYAAFQLTQRRPVLNNKGMHADKGHFVLETWLNAAVTLTIFRGASTGCKSTDSEKGLGSRRLSRPSQFILASKRGVYHMTLTIQGRRRTPHGLDQATYSML